MNPNDLAAFPHIFPPLGAVHFVRTGLLTIPDAVGSTLLETIQLTSNMVGWIRQIGLEAGDFSVINFQLQSGGAAIRDYSNISVPLGNVSTPMSIFVDLPRNQPMNLFAVSAGGAAVPVRWLVAGWYINPDVVGS